MASTTYTTALQKLYVAYFNRPADTAGLAYWEAVVEAANGDTTAASAAFAASAEYKAEYGSLTNTQVITQIYQNLFGHAPDAAGRAYWVDKLDNKIFTIDQIVAEVAGGALTTDKTAYTNKVAAAEAFTNALTTTAQQTAYSGDDANTAAKAFIASITTDATLANALVPANLANSVSTVVKAGTPFTLVGGLDDLAAAHAAVDAFLATLDLDDDATTDTTATDVHTAQDTAELAVAGLVTGYATATTAVKAALLADAQDDLNTAVANAQTAYNTAAKNADAVKGLTAAIATATSAADSVDAAQKAETKTLAAEAAALASFNTLNGLTASVDATTGVVTGIIKLNTAGTALVLETGVTEANHPGVTALLASIKAELSSVSVVNASIDAKAIADLDVNIRDSAGSSEVTALATLGSKFTATEPVDDAAPTAAEVQVEIATLKGLLAAAAAGTPHDDAAAALLAFQNAVSDFNTGNSNPLAGAVATAQTNLDGATDAVNDLATAVIDLNTANGNETTLTNLENAVTAAQNAFANHDFKAPVDVASTFYAATAGSDIYLAGTTNATIANFGLQGTDVLYIGKDYTWNKGALTTGDNAVLEVFLIQSGANTIVNLETKVFGSNSTAEAEIQITLTGVTAADLTVKDGIISFA